MGLNGFEKKKRKTQAHLFYMKHFFYLLLLTISHEIDDVAKLL